MNSDFEIDFEWPMAAKYELQLATAQEIAKLRAEKPHTSEAAAAEIANKIVPVGPFKNRRPKDAAMELAVRALVECKQTSFEKVALAVARAVGTHTCVPGMNDPVDYYRHDAELLRLMFEGRGFSREPREGGGWGPLKEYKWPAPETQQVGQLGVFLVPNKDNKPLLALRPETLHDALVLYAARMIATGTTFNICENCKAPFLSGGHRGRNKRGDSKFCSSGCRWKWHNETRRKAR
jgi:hypothetical protein